MIYFKVETINKEDYYNLNKKTTLTPTDQDKSEKVRFILSSEMSNG